jgi:hypothetical protein
MVETHWSELRGKRLRYRDRTWELTGDVEVRASGDQLAVEARQADDVRRGRALLHFGIVDGTDSLNPGNLGDHSDRLERTDSGQHLVVGKGSRTYRYELRRLEHDRM